MSPGAQTVSNPYCQMAPLGRRVQETRGHSQGEAERPGGKRQLRDHVLQHPGVVPHLHRLLRIVFQGAGEFVEGALDGHVFNVRRVRFDLARRARGRGHRRLSVPTKCSACLTGRKWIFLY